MSTVQTQFFAAMAPGALLPALFDQTPEIFVFAKDAHYRFSFVNRALLDRLGIAKESDIIGHTDYDFFDTEMADRYRVEDREVVEGKEPVLNRIWHVPNGKGGLDWYLSSKHPVFSNSGRVIGLFGLMRDADCAGAMLGKYADMKSVINYVVVNYAEQIEIGTLARIANLSVSQFERRFKVVFKITPLRYINKVRIDAACQMLVRTDAPLTWVALQSGFYDHSYFAKRFKAQMGKSPSVYRREYFEVGS